MRKHEIKTTNLTFSLPLDISSELRAYVKSRERSHFVAEAIRKEIEAKKEELRQEYLSASEDEGQIEAMKDWDGTLSDGLE